MRKLRTEDKMMIVLLVIGVVLWIIRIILHGTWGW